MLKCVFYFRLIQNANSENRNIHFNDDLSFGIDYVLAQNKKYYNKFLGFLTTGLKKKKYILKKKLNLC